MLRELCFKDSFFVWLKCLGTEAEIPHHPTPFSMGGPKCRSQLSDVMTVILLMDEILRQVIGSSSRYLQGFVHARQDFFHQ